jgi:RNA polymerase sigma-70 factor (ECF subfamily)
MPRYSDEQILERVRDAHTREQGFRMLLDTYQERLYGHIRHLVGGHDDASDVLQNCLLSVVRGIGQFEGRSALYTWLFRIASNEAMTFLGRRKRQGAVSLDGEEEKVARALQADPWFDGDALQSALQRALQQLPDRQRQVFTLRYFEELSYRDIAQVLDLSEGALKASFHHAAKKIERYIEENGLD